jgi:hypothetical protein
MVREEILMFVWTEQLERGLEAIAFAANPCHTSDGPQQSLLPPEMCRRESSRIRPDRHRAVHTGVIIPDRQLDTAQKTLDTRRPVRGIRTVGPSQSMAPD